MTPIPPHDVYHTGRQRLGRQVWSFQRVESTNTLALSLGNDLANDGLVLLAHEQTSGRGQNGRTWTAPAGSSVLLSVLLFPPVLLRRPALLTAWAAVSVCETIDEVVGLPARIKWPNDVLVQGRKVCGILIEQRHAGARERQPATVVGIGLNVQQSAGFFDKANLPLAASLASLSGKTLETRLVANCQRSSKLGHGLRSSPARRYRHPGNPLGKRDWVCWANRSSLRRSIRKRKVGCWTSPGKEFCSRNRAQRCKSSRRWCGTWSY